MDQRHTTVLPEPSDPTDFVGAGWSFPVRVSSRGGVALDRGGDEIRNSIAMILETAPGERVMRPDFGCAIWDHLFHGTDPTTLGLMKQAVRDALGRWEPRVRVDDVRIDVGQSSSECVRIEIDFTVKATNDKRNLVHPFYVIPREE